MNTNPKSTVVILALLGFACALGQESPSINPGEHTNTLYLSPASSLINSIVLEQPIVSIAYEKSLPGNGISVLLPLHAGWWEDRDEKEIAIGGGIGIRKYFGKGFSGSYLNFQSDYINHYSRQRNYGVFPPPDSLGKPQPPPTYLSSEYDFLSVTHLSLGYKWVWSQVALDLGGGGGFYAQDKEKRTNFVGTLNIGFPFNAETFGF